MKKILLALALLLPSPAMAGVSCSVPFNLTNGTTADASQVMANYNALISCLANAAADGANSDITSLTGITTPILPTAGGSPVFYAPSGSGGSANAQTITVVPSNFTLTAGYTVVFSASFSNTGAMTLNVNGTGAKSVTKSLYQSNGLTTTSLVPNDVRTGSVVMVVFDGSGFELVTPYQFWGTLSLGTGSPGNTPITVDCTQGPTQSVINGGAFTIQTGGVTGGIDSTCDLEITNNASAGVITWSGFFGSSNGDALTTTNGNSFFVHIRRIGGASDRVVKALQ